MGKTSLLIKVADELTSAGRVVIRISAETSEVTIFAQRLIGELRQHKLIRQRISRWEKEVRGEVSMAIFSSGIKLVGAAKQNPGQDEQLDVVELLSTAGGSAGVVLIIDEITVLCQALGPAAAMEFLSGLRAVRQSESPLSLVISGSIGLHHALSDTRVINDLWSVKVGPLNDSESRELTTRLLMGINAEANPQLIDDIIAATSGIPFYIQAVVDRFRDRRGQRISDIVQQSIFDNDWHTEHYVSRLDDYYGESSARLARAILDEFAHSYPEALDIEALHLRLSVGTQPAPTRDELLDIIGRLEKDHYLSRTGIRDTMSSALLARIWRIHRRLA